MSDAPIFALPPGVDFPKELLIGLEQRLYDADPVDWARTEIYVNTRRMQRRLLALFHAGPPRLLPKIRLVSELGQYAADDAVPLVSRLRRNLELRQLVVGLLDQAPELAPASSAFDLADSLGILLDEMQGEGADIDTLLNLDVSGFSEYWARTRAFLEIAETYARETGHGMQARNRLAAERLLEKWDHSPPQNMIVLAGSTGSRGATALFMQAVAKCPRGAIILPGFDFDQPDAVWKTLGEQDVTEDHPQFRFRALMSTFGISPGSIRRWTDAQGPSPERNRLISLALRPAPVTDMWLDEGRDLTGITGATQNVTLIEAQSPRQEALAIALRLRQAAEEGITAALISPDRMLTRQVTAALDRWRIEPDDSAGEPLHLSVTGRFLRHVSTLFGQKLTSDGLIALLKHPLSSSVEGVRGPHLLWSRALELHLRETAAPFPQPGLLQNWAMGSTDGRADWAAWLSGLLHPVAQFDLLPLQDYVAQFVALAEALAAGPNGEGSGQLWDRAGGEEARKVLTELQQDAEFGGQVTAHDFREILNGVLSRGEVRDPMQPHPKIMIWGTLEARVQGAELVILGGLNENTWPTAPAPDPWLNREMRKKSGLMLPDRAIGLAAHDFQQAAAAQSVVLSRAVRDQEAETVPSRWLNRLTNLLSGLPGGEGKVALTGMRERGQVWLTFAANLDTPAQKLPPAPRPSPQPPVETRPKRLSVTALRNLIRDPYAVYADRVLGLRALGPLRPEADAALRGTILHRVLEQFIAEPLEDDPGQAAARLSSVAAQVLDDDAPWPTARILWHARLRRVADWFVAEEQARRQAASWRALEVGGKITLADGMEITAKADRIDALHDGRLVIFDYKTGTPPTRKQVEEFDKQLLLEACMAERGGFKDIDPAEVAEVAYIGLGSTPKTEPIPLETGETAQIWAELLDLLDHYKTREQGYTARRAMHRTDIQSDYDHLSRFGEWTSSTDPTPLKVGG